MSPPLPYRAVLFDKDGTLVDAFDGWVTLVRRLHDHLAARYGAPPLAAEDERALGIAGDQALPGGVVVSGTEDELFAVLHRLAGPRAPGWPAFHAEIRSLAQSLFTDSPPAVRPLGPVKETLATLKARGLRLGVATSDTYENAVRDLGPFGAEVLEFWATFDRLDHPKPHPESVHRFCRALGVAPAEVVFVGDSRVDLEAARAAGVGLFVAVRSRTCPDEVAAAADATVGTVAELPFLLFGN
jgi:phosphoglycolate phosphatase